MRFFQIEDIISIHDDEISRFGGMKGIRDFNLLESALLRMKTTFNGEELYPDIFQKAASLKHSINKKSSVY